MHEFPNARSSRWRDQCTLFIAVGTSGIVEPAAGFVSRVAGRAWTIYVGPDDPANDYYFTRKIAGKAGKVLPALFGRSR